MFGLFAGMPHCKRCNRELEGDEEACPSCDYSPKQVGLRMATGSLFVVVSSVILAQLSLLAVPRAGIYFIMLGGIAFVFAFCMFCFAMIVTPYRFGAVLKRF